MDEKLKDNSKKRLSLMYLANDVVQQARHKRKPDFITEFSRILPSVLQAIFKDLDSNIQQKVERLLGVWDQRKIFGTSEVNMMRKAVNALKGGTDITLAPETVQDTRPANSPKISTDLVHLNNMFLHLNQILEISHANLAQVGQQSVKYLSHDEDSLSVLPLPKVYISKLNVLEKLCKITIQNVEDIKKLRQEILQTLNTLQTVISEGLSTDDVKLKIVNSKMERLYQTRLELQEMEADEERENSHQTADDDTAGESAPTNSSSSDMVPTYEDSSDSDEVSAPSMEPLPKKRKLSDAKKVAFSEDIQIKEYDRDDDTATIKVVRSDTDSDDEYTPVEPDLPADFESHHKDDLELLHNKQGSVSDSNESNGDSGAELLNGLLSLLSKLS